MTGLSVWQEKAAKDFMIDHYGEYFPMAAAASAAGLSVRDFVKRFKAITGLSPSQWLLRYRIGQAKQYLAARALPLGEIARRCGFIDEDHFRRGFRRVTGVTPSEWRARWLQ
nr:AraC family transcriptional regulator [Sinorhizobium sp. 7-81]